MRFCVSGRQSYSVIKNADEIKFEYNDKNKIIDMIEDYSEKTIILDVPKDEEDWNTWQLYTEKFNNFYIALHNLMRSNEFNKANIKWYWPYPITSFYELQKIIEKEALRTGINGSTVGNMLTLKSIYEIDQDRERFENEGFIVQPTEL